MFKKLLIANRGEIAVRIARTAAELGLPTVAVYAEDDEAGLHRHAADEAVALRGKGAVAYLDAAQLLDAARAHGCDAVHPGYGFLSENAAFARACAQAGLAFVGPSPQVLERLGDKAQARALAAGCGVPVLPGTQRATSLDEAREFLRALPPGAGMVIKAIAGGGGRGIRFVSAPDELDEAYARCQSEAAKAFGAGDVYVEQWLPVARHIEVQVLGDGREVAHLWERECTLQRRSQKLVEIAPSPSIEAGLRAQLVDASLAMARELGYQGLGTFEFLVHDGGFHFIEANPRLQVEHTVTETVCGLDLVAVQLRLAAGDTLRALGLSEPPAPRGHAMQLRLNAETMTPDGQARPSGGRLGQLHWPGGPGVRVDTHAYAGCSVGTGYDSLLAKLIVHEPSRDTERLVQRALRALRETRIGGVATNREFLLALLQHPDVAAHRVHTRFIEAHAPTLAARAQALSDAHRLPPPVAHDAAPQEAADIDDIPDAVPAPVQGVLLSLDVEPGQRVAAGDRLAVIESMKMEHLVTAPAAGVVLEWLATAGEVVREGRPLVRLETADTPAAAQASVEAIDLGRIRPDLAEAIERHAIGLDERRPEAVAKRHARGQRTARENVADLVDAGSFIEYGALAVAAQRSRRSLDDLMRNTPADGIITGIGTVNAAQFGPSASRCAVLAYDYTVLAGTQGMYNHMKTDRLLQVAHECRLPVVLFAEGGGGRPGDVDLPIVAGLDCTTFHRYAALSGLVPRVGIVAGRCFAGNAALLGSSDVIIATHDTTVGMSGPAMIEGGGLGVVAPQDVGPTSVQAPNGVIDVLVEDEAEAVRVARQYLGYFQGPLAQWQAEDQRLLRHLVPENRVRVYDVRRVLHTLADAGSVLELRSAFGTGVVTALARIEGRPVGVVANNPRHLGGALDAPACDKMARFLQLCDAFGLPVVSLCDTPGFMVGPDSERQAMVRKASRLFVTGASMQVPVFTVVLRKGYGLGAQAMAAGSFHAPVFTVAWPSGEFGAMGIEGAVRLGFRRELDAVADPAERQALFERMVAEAYEKGKALNMAAHLEIDDVIDPADTRRWLARGLETALPAVRAERPRRMIDTW
ncbi:carboxyl transferase domain-containing protein [Schlegelella aquatica]|uniref:carboxyl transferase domain-containing protein n=1 Tax=Caldimonas aquatica TaxID=376175 RepID=UPI0037522024